MPGGDGTGPLGLGSMTGRAAGYCAGYAVPGYMNPVPARRLGVGRGCFSRGAGRGFRYWNRSAGYAGWAAPYAGRIAPAWVYPYAQQPTAGEEMEMLNEQAQILRQQLEDVQKRIDTLKKSDVQEKE